MTRVAKQEGHEKKLRAKKVKAFDAQDDSAKSAAIENYSEYSSFTFKSTGKDANSNPSGPLPLGLRFSGRMKLATKVPLAPGLLIAANGPFASRLHHKGKAQAKRELQSTLNLLPGHSLTSHALFCLNLATLKNNSFRVQSES